MSDPTSKYEGTLGQIQRRKQQESASPQEDKPASVQVREAANAHVPEVPTPAVQHDEDPRERYTSRLPRSLVKALKRYALDHDLNDYEVLEQAAREFLERHGD